MPDSIDDLARRWMAQPDAAGAITICDALRKSGPVGRGPLVDQVGKLAAEKHGSDGGVLLAVARLYTAVERLSDAQGLLVSAGKVAPRDAMVFRLLGEVLLRRGDAERAEKVLERAKQLGANDAETEMWMDRAKVFKPVQAKAGPRAVAVEVKNTAVLPVSSRPAGLAPPGGPPPIDPAHKPSTNPYGAPASKPAGKALPAARPHAPSVDQDALTAVRAVPPGLREGDGDETKIVPPQSSAAPAQAKPPPLAAPARGPAPKPAAAPPQPRPAVAQPKPAAAAPAKAGASLSMPTEANPLRGVLDFPRDIPSDAPLDLPNDFMQVPTGPKLSPDAPAIAEAVPATGPLPSAPSSSNRSSSRPTVPSGDGELSSPGAHSSNGAALDSGAASSPARMPAAKEVLDALTNAGVFEVREASANPIVWDRPTEKARRRSAVALGLGIVLFVGGSFGVYNEIQRRRARDHDEAEATLAKVEADLESSKTSLLPVIEQNIGHAFELDSRSPRAAADWLEERAVKGLLQGGAELAFEDAVARALEVKVPEDQVAFARVCAFLFQGDTGGAAGLMPKWDTPAAKQPLYQLVTGATLERAGDPHAAERYQAATALAPKLIVADILLARATAIDGDPSKAADLAKQFRAKYPDRPEGAALAALAWGRDPARGEQAPPDVAEAITHANELPTPLLSIPHALEAILALDKHQVPEAKTAIEKGLSVADGPGMATWLGSLALDTHDEPLVRKAALLAVTFSAVYVPARVLAARIALLSGRLDDALKATEELDATSPDVAIVRAAAAYERVDADAVSRALEAVPAETKKLPAFSAVNLAEGVLLGHESETWPAADAPTKLLEISRDEAPWSDLIAMDVALDLGLTDVADKIIADWKGQEDKPLKAIRLSRLARYENHLDEADHYSKTAIEAATVTPRILIERVLLLVAKNRVSEVGPLLAKYPLVLGPASSWLSAYALASTGKLEEARGRTAQLDFPPPLSPLPYRVMAAVSLGAMKDKKRGEPAVKTLLAAGSADPDLLAAAISLGLKPAAHPAPAPAGRRKR